MAEEARAVSCVKVIIAFWPCPQRVGGPDSFGAQSSEARWVMTSSISTRLLLGPFFGTGRGGIEDLERKADLLVCTGFAHVAN